MQPSRPIAAVTVCLALCGCGNLFGPVDYDECVLQGLSGVEDATEVASVKRQCRQQFPGHVKQERSRTLAARVVDRLSLEADLVMPDYLNIVVHNGNPGIFVSELTIATVSGTGEDAVRRFHTVVVHLPPLGSTDLGLHLADEPKPDRWEIAAARGYDT